MHGFTETMGGFAGTVVLQLELMGRVRRVVAEFVGPAVTGMRMVTGLWRRGLRQLGTEVSGRAGRGEFVEPEVPREGMTAEFAGTMAVFTSPALVRAEVEAL